MYIYIDDHNKIILINNGKNINKNYNCTSQFSPIFVNKKPILPRYEVHITKPHNVFATDFKNRLVSSFPRSASANGEHV